MNSGSLEVADADFMEAYPNTEFFVKFSDLAALPSAIHNSDYAAALRVFGEFCDEQEGFQIRDFKLWCNLRLSSAFRELGAAPKKE